MGRRNPPAESGVYQTAVTISTRVISTAKGADLVCVDISSNQPITFSREDNPEQEHVYGLLIAVQPRQPVYVDSGDLSFILVQCGDTIACFIASTPLLFRVTPHNLTPLVLEYHSSFYELVFLDQPIHIETEHP